MYEILIRVISLDEQHTDKQFDWLHLILTHDYMDLNFYNESLY